MFSIGELSKRTETKVETIRYYERIGLLAKPERTAGNYRLYSETDLARLSFIRRSRDLGFSIEDVKALMNVSNDKERSCSEVDALARHHIQDIDRKISHLKAMRTELGNLIDQCGHGLIADCRIVEALASQKS